MHKIDSAGSTSDNHFTDGDPTIPVPATVVAADWLNAVQEEFAAVIEGAGITLDKEDNGQLAEAIAKLMLANNGTPFVGQWVSLRSSEPPEGYYARNGALIENASTTVPKLWAYLQEDANSEQCITQTEWTAMQAVTHTLATGTEVPIWNGVGGVPFYVLDVEADTLRLPDTRGMYAEDTGFDGLAVGGAHGDMIRNITGDATLRANSLCGVVNGGSGVFSKTGSDTQNHSQAGTSTSGLSPTLNLNTARVVPTGNANKPRGFGMLGCIYAG